jgi:hypothetical protein
MQSPSIWYVSTRKRMAKARELLFGARCACIVVIKYSTAGCKRYVETKNGGSEAIVIGEPAEEGLMTLWWKWHAVSSSDVTKRDGSSMEGV